MYPHQERITNPLTPNIGNPWMKRDPRTLAMPSVRPAAIDRDYRASFLLHLLPPCRRHFTLCTRYYHLVTPRSSHEGRGNWGKGAVNRWKKKSIDPPLANALSIIIHSLSRNGYRFDYRGARVVGDPGPVENNRADRRACTDRAMRDRDRVEDTGERYLWIRRTRTGHTIADRYSPRVTFYTLLLLQL